MSDNGYTNDVPSQFQIFKKRSAMRIQLAKSEQRFKTGCLFLQVAPAKGR